jgi:hypothetical protein
VVGSLSIGILGAIAFIAREARARAPMLPLSLFRERNFTIGNLATLTTYLGLGGVIFLLPVFLQEVSGYSPVQAGLALLPVTSLMIMLSRRFGALADRIGSRVLISLGAVIAACGLLLLVRVDQRADYVGEVLPALLVFGLGLAMLVAPLTATILEAVEQGQAARSTPWRAGAPQSHVRQRVGVCVPRGGRNRSHPRRGAAVSSLSPGSATPAARWPPNCVQLGRSAEPARNSSALSSTRRPSRLRRTQNPVVATEMRRRESLEPAVHVTQSAPAVVGRSASHLRRSAICDGCLSRDPSPG